MVRNITYSPWEGMKSPWLCFMAKLSLFGLLWLFPCCYIFSFLWFPGKVFPQAKGRLSDMGWGCGGEDHKVLCSISLLLQWHKVWILWSPPDIVTTPWDDLHGRAFSTALWLSGVVLRLQVVLHVWFWTYLLHKGCSSAILDPPPSSGLFPPRV